MDWLRSRRNEGFYYARGISRVYKRHECAHEDEKDEMLRERERETQNEEVREIYNGNSRHISAIILAMRATNNAKQLCDATVVISI